MALEKECGTQCPKQDYYENITHSFKKSIQHLLNTYYYTHFTGS